MVRTNLMAVTLSLSLVAPAFAADHSADYDSALAKKLSGCVALQEALHDGYAAKGDNESADQTANIATAYKMAAGYYSGTYDMDEAKGDAGNKFINDEIDARKAEFAAAIVNRDEAMLTTASDQCTTEDITKKVQYGYSEGQKQVMGN